MVFGSELSVWSEYFFSATWLSASSLWTHSLCPLKEEKTHLLFQPPSPLTLFSLQTIWLPQQKRCHKHKQGKICYQGHSRFIAPLSSSGKLTHIWPIGTSQQNPAVPVQACWGITFRMRQTLWLANPSNVQGSQATKPLPNTFLYVVFFFFFSSFAVSLLQNRFYHLALYKKHWNLVFCAQPYFLHNMEESAGFKGTLNLGTPNSLQILQT